MVERSERLFSTPRHKVGANQSLTFFSYCGLLWTDCTHSLDVFGLLLFFCNKGFDSPGHHWAGVSLYKSEVAKFAVTQKFVDEFLNICFTSRKLGLDYESKWLIGISVHLDSNTFVIVTNFSHLIAFFITNRLHVILT